LEAADPPLRAALRTAQAQVDWTNLARRERLRVLRAGGRVRLLGDGASRRAQ
jgi:hypothetical protein